MKPQTVPVNAPVLTPEIRTYLGTVEARKIGRNGGRVYFYDAMLEFMRRFELTPEQAGRFIAQWLIETFPRKP
jgi:hypothetical protein